MADNDFEKAVPDNACGVRADAQVPEDIWKILKPNQNLEEVFSKMSENDKFFAAVILACASLIGPKEKGCEKCTSVHGRWIETPSGRMVCSRCWNYPLYDYFGRLKHSDYCPSFGAKMDGDAPEQENDEVCEACAITYSWERGEANILGETNDAGD